MFNNYLFNKHLIRACLAAVFALGLAACSSSSDQATAPDPMPAEPDPEMACTDAGGRWNADMTCTSAEDLAALHDAQTTTLANAVTALQAIDLGDLSTQDKIDAAETAVAAVREALDAATELSDAEKAAAMTELATANRTVMMAQGRVDKASQMTALADAVTALGMIDLDALMTQAEIDAADAAIIALDLALAAATDLTDAEKLNATVDVTVAKRKVEAARTVLASNIDGQRTVLMTAGDALDAIDLEDLSDQAKIDAAQAAVDALKAALDAATHLSDSEKATYQSQLTTATETVRTAQTGMDLNERMTAQRTAIMNAVEMARTAVAGVNDDSTDSEVAAADSAIAALKQAIEDAADLPEGDTDVAMAQGTLDTLEPQLAAAKTSRTAAMAEADKEERMAMAATGKAMHPALGGPTTATDTTVQANTALANIAAPTLTPADGELSVDAAANAGALATDPALATLEAGDSAGSLDSWMGTDYALTTGTGASKVTNEARVYTNQGDPVPGMAFNAKYTLLPAGQTDPKNDGRVQVAQSATPIARVEADTFTHSGTLTHSRKGNDDAVYVGGSYDGVPGEFRCATATGCQSTNDGKGSPSALVGDWYFKPTNPLQKVSAPDASYLYFGWWVRKNDKGMPTAASAFSGVEAPDTTTADALRSDSGANLTGSATYNGSAVGKFAINNVLEGTGDGGHFTADATLIATFGDPSTTDEGQGITGTIDNFRLNDGSEDPNWSVSLRRRGWAANGAIGAPLDNPDTATVDESVTGVGSTVWSINDNPAPASGVWAGQMYDELPGTTDATPPGDGSNIPTTVTGTFYSEFSTIGRMVGAFGADKQ